MSFISKISPKWALSRELSRQKLSALSDVKNYTSGAASTTEPWARAYPSTPHNVEYDINQNLPILHGRARETMMNNPLANGAIKKIRTNAVGSGLLLNPKPDANALNLSSDEVIEWERNVKREWALWAKTTDCDAARRLTFGQIQGLAFVSALVNGDVFAITPYKPIKGQPYDLRIQLIEADRVQSPNGLDTDNIAGGIRLGDHGESKSIFVFSDSNFTIGDYKEIPFFGENGTRLVYHLLQDVDRVGQVRGVTMLAPIMQTLVQIGRYNNAELMANVVSSMMTVFITSEVETNGLADGIPYNQQVAPDDDQVVEMGNGSVVQLNAGENVKEVNAGRQNTSFDSVMTSFVRLLGIGLEIPYEVLIGHFQASYSAARGALQEAWKMYSMRREWFVESFCQPIYEQWLTEAVAKGRIKADGFFLDPAIRAAWCGSNWIGPNQPSLNPSQEALANRTSLEIGVTTRDYIIQQQTGMTFDQVTDTLERENKARREANLISEVDNELA